MGVNAREKTLRAGAIGRKRNVPRPPPVTSLTSDPTNSKISSASFPTPVPSTDPGLVLAGSSTASALPSLNLNLGSPASAYNPNPAGFDESGWGYCTEEQLEEIVINNLDCVYKEAISRLVTLGYEETLALRAVLCNGHCCGAMDVISNIIQNALTYLNTEAGATAADGDPPAGAFSDLRRLEEYSLAGMVCLLQHSRPDLSRGEAMWCLLMSGLQVNRASTIELPSLPFPAYPLSNDASYPTASSCQFHAFGGDYFGGDAGATANGVVIQPTESIKRSDTPPALKSILKQHITEYCPEMKMLVRQRQQMEDEEAEDVVQSVLKRMESMRIQDEEDADKELQDQKKEMIMDLIRQIRELEGQVKERKEWAQQKAMQAARKLSSDLHELRILRLEREENQRIMKGKQALEDSTLKRLAEMETALKKASGQVDRANAVVKKLETQNAEIRAEMEASKLSASESVTACMEVTKREKKCLKKLMAWEKQKEKLQEEIAEKRKKIAQMQQQLTELQEATRHTEVRWRQEVKAKEEALVALEEEHRAKDVAEASCKRRQEGLRHKIGLDFQRYKDDVHRLEEELSRLRAIVAASQLNQTREADALKPLVESNPKVLPIARELPRNNNHRVLHLSTRHEISFRDESTRSSSKQLGLPNRDTNERDEYNDTRKVQSNIEHHINFTLRTAREEDEDI
ncbi:hypothetical protein HPP92_027726 [Vanilla planifolia]|uniref:PIR2-like helical domain-containing protein n=1 Tax=Vanilla planifolia TaxID=51239 RepID=A0A835PBG0_VANPL|nr:hypothetical protein HPP92_027726 [Vanilla planifolia]